MRWGIYNDKAKYNELICYYRYKEKNGQWQRFFSRMNKYGNLHAVQRLAERDLTLDDAQAFVGNAVFTLKQKKGTVYTFCSANSFAAVDIDVLLHIAGRLDEKGKKYLMRR